MSEVVIDGPATLPIPLSMFDEQVYLRSNPDVAAAVAAGHMTAYGHYVAHGHEEEKAGRRPRLVPKRLEGVEVFRANEPSLIDRIIALETEKRVILNAWESERQNLGQPTFEKITEPPDASLVPPLDRPDCDESRLDEDQKFWRENGYVIKPGFMPPDLLDQYARIRERHPSAGGWTCWCPYMHVPELRNVSLYPPLVDLLTRLIGEEPGLMLNLTGWISTDRNYHQDNYLNAPFVNSWYAATWIALDDIHPDCGPFEFVPGSHKWDEMRSALVRLYLTPEERRSGNWPKLSEGFLNRVALEEIARRGAESKKFIAKKGDLLIWHGRLMHRGSNANVPGMIRKALISHYTGLSHGIDMPEVSRTETGGAYFVHDVPLDFDPYALMAAE